MADFKDRAVGAVVGGFVADAAAVALHWIYDVAKIKEIVGEKNPEFFGPGHNNCYKVPSGANSFYIDQALVLLESLVACKGWNKSDFSDRLYKAVGPGSPFDHEGRLGRKVEKSDWPVDGPWADQTIKNFVQNVKDGKQKTGADLNLPDGMYRVAPMVAFYAGKPDLRTVVEEMVRVTNENDEAVTGAISFAKMLEGIITEGPECKCVNKGLDMAKDDLKTWLSDVEKDKGKPHIEAVCAYGQNCHFPQCFKGAVHGILSSSSDLTAAVRQDILAGGDSCGRCAAIGAAIGARVGIKGLPKELLSKTSNAAKVQKLTEELVAMRT